MLLDLVYWSFTLVVAPLAVGLAWRQTNAAVQGLISALHGPSAWPGENDPAGKRSIRHGFIRERGRVSNEALESLRRCDLLIAEAEGDVPLQAFWAAGEGRVSGGPARRS